MLEGFVEGHTNFEGDQLRHFVSQAIRLVLYTSDIPDHRFGRHGAKGDDLRDRLLAVGVCDVLNDLVASLHTEVHVEVGHGYPLRVQKAFKQQVIFERVQIRNFQRIRHQRSGT